MQKHSLHVKKWRERNPLKCTAHWKVNRAIRTGQLIKDPCVKCGNLISQAHHSDYTKPLDVIWLCVKCHKKEHLTTCKTGDYRRPYIHTPLLVIDGKLRNKNASYSKYKAIIIELRNKGLSFSKIGKECGLSTSTAFKIYTNSKYK